MSHSRDRDATSTRCDRARRVALAGFVAVVLPLIAVVGCDDTEDEAPVTSTVTTVSDLPTTAQDQTRDTSRDGTGDQTPDTERDRDRTDQTG